MGANNQFDWVEFYKELADNLLKYKNNRAEMIAKVKKIYQITGINLPTLEKDNKIVDIDPFTFFGLFNKKITDSNRHAILNAVAGLFDIQTPVPTAFDSIPVLNPQNATYYLFITKRDKSDIDDLWNLFENALAYAENPNENNLKKLSKYFDISINKKGNGNSKITMGLYWISPDSFLNLDQRNKWYIYESGKIPKKIVDTLPEAESKIPSATYFEIVEKLRAYLQSGNSTLKNFKELSFEAWKYSEQVNQEMAAQNVAPQRDSTGAAVADEDVETVHYWIYAPGDGAAYWDEFYDDGIMAIGWDPIGDLTQYETKSEMKQAMKDEIDDTRPFKNAAHATWQFANEMEPGDIVFVKKGMHQIVGRGIVESDYYFDEDREYFKNVRQVRWTHKGEWAHPGQAVMKTLTDITAYSDYVERLNSIFESDIADDVEEPTETNLVSYSPEDFLDQVYMDRTKYNTLVALIKKKKNVILQGAPGVGKTYAAKRLAYSIMGVKDPERVMMVQFHQSYSYEDFIMGYRPTQEGGFKLEKGVFYEFCKSAEEDDEDTPYFFIIDEINRGNLSKIFGELFMLIEADKRGIELKLLYKDEKFSIPKNVHIIGMMNTADRSLAMMDYALRRRFAFFNMEPGFNTDGFRRYRDGLSSDKFNSLISCVENLNVAISSDESLGEGFCIGHSYFCDLEDTSHQTLSEIVEFEIIPLLKEYWFDEPVKAKTWIDYLRSSIK